MRRMTTGPGPGCCSKRPRWMFLAAALAGVVVGGAAALRTAAIEPFLVMTPEFVGMPPGDGEIWNVKVETRGGPVMLVTVETPPGVRCVNGDVYGPLALDRGHRFRFQASPGTKLPVNVTIVQTDNGRREYVVPIGARE